MNDNSSQSLPLTAAYIFGTTKGLASEIDSIRNLVIEWDSSYTSSLRKGYVVELFEKHGVFEEFKQLHWPAGNTAKGQSKRARFLRIRKKYEDFLSGKSEDTAVGIDAISVDDAEEIEQKFAAESDLRDFLSLHPNCIEAGLTIFVDADGRKGIEYPIDSGFIDLLAQDANGKLVVIELKVGKGRNRTIGQLLYYMGWVDKNLGKGTSRGMIIAKSISPDLQLAVQRVPGVSLFQYQINVSVQKLG